MITGDPALDLWLHTHGYDIAVAVLFISAALVFLPGLIVLLGEEES